MLSAKQTRSAVRKLATCCVTSSQAHLDPNSRCRRCCCSCSCTRKSSRPADLLLATSTVDYVFAVFLSIFCFPIFFYLVSTHHDCTSQIFTFMGSPRPVDLFVLPLQGVSKAFTKFDKCLRVCLAPLEVDTIFGPKLVLLCYKNRGGR